MCICSNAQLHKKINTKHAFKFFFLTELQHKQALSVEFQDFREKKFERTAARQMPEIIDI